RAENLRDAPEPLETEYDFVSSIRLSLGTGQKQRAAGELASPRCLFACQRLEPGGRRWGAQLSGERFVRTAVSSFRISARIRRFHPTDSACVLLSIGRSRFGTFHAIAAHRRE